MGSENRIATTTTWWLNLTRILVVVLLVSITGVVASCDQKPLKKTETPEQAAIREILAGLDVDGPKTLSALKTLLEMDNTWAEQKIIKFIKDYPLVPHPQDALVEPRGETNRQFVLFLIGFRRTDRVKCFLEEIVRNPKENPRDIRAALHGYEVAGGDTQLIISVMKRLTDEGNNGYVPLGYTYGGENGDHYIWDPAFLPVYEYLLEHLKYDAWRGEVIMYLKDYNQDNIPAVRNHRQRVRAKFESGGYSQNTNEVDNEQDIRAIFSLMTEKYNNEFSEKLYRMQHRQEE